MTSISSSAAALEVELQEKEIMQKKCQVHAGEEDLDGQHQHVDTTPRGRVSQNEDRDKWRKYVHGVANPRIEDGLRTEMISLPVVFLNSFFFDITVWYVGW